MQTYDAELVLGGTPITNTVIKTGLTAPEILLLRALHGQTSVIDIKPRSMDKRSHIAERDRLAALYGESPDGARAIVHLFGPAGMRLPVKLEDYEGAAEYEAGEIQEDGDGEPKRPTLSLTK